MNCENLESVTKQLLFQSPDLCLTMTHEVIVMPNSKIAVYEKYCTIDEDFNFIIMRKMEESEPDLIRRDIETLKQAVKFLK